MRQYKQLTHEQRYCIYVLKQANLSNRDIAKKINVHHSTVSRELKRNVKLGYKVYRHGIAQILAMERRKLCRKQRVLTSKNSSIVTDKLKKHWSPEQISGWLKLHRVMNVSHQTIYNYIWTNKVAGGKLYKYLRRKRKYRKIKVLKRGIIGRVSIDERPKEVDLKNRIGDWEVDTIVSKKHKDVLVTLVERCSKYTLIGKSKSKYSSLVAKKMRNMLSFYKEKVFTITSDNGLEFAQHKRISNWLDADYYFCHPYSSWERGLNENTNGLIRQYVPKKSDFSNLSENRIKQIMRNLNHRPRKSLGYKTPHEVFYEK